MLGLLWHDVQLQPGRGSPQVVRSVTATRRKVSVAEETKGKVNYRVAVHDSTVRALVDHREAESRYSAEAGTSILRNGYMLTGVFDGAKPLSPEAVKSWWRRLKQRVRGLEYYRFHDLRPRRCRSKSQTSSTLSFLAIASEIQELYPPALGRMTPIIGR